MSIGFNGSTELWIESTRPNRLALRYSSYFNCLFFFKKILFKLPEVIVTDLRLNLYALYAACYLAVDMNDTALQWAFKYLSPPHHKVFSQKKSTFAY